MSIYWHNTYIFLDIHWNIIFQRWELQELASKSPLHIQIFFWNCFSWKNNTKFSICIMSIGIMKQALITRSSIKGLFNVCRTPFACCCLIPKQTTQWICFSSLFIPHINKWNKKSRKKVPKNLTNKKNGL